MSAVLDHSPMDEARELLRQHKSDPEAAILACLAEIDRLGIMLERATTATTFGYTWGRLRNPKAVTPAPVDKREPLDD